MSDLYTRRRAGITAARYVPEADGLRDVLAALGLLGEKRSGCVRCGDPLSLKSASGKSTLRGHCTEACRNAGVREGVARPLVPGRCRVCGVTIGSPEQVAAKTVSTRHRGHGLCPPHYGIAKKIGVI